MNERTIAFFIRQLLGRVLKVVAGMVVVVMVSLYLFSSYTAVVNQAGIVRGGSQRIVKQVLAGADSSKVMANVEGLLNKLDGAILLGSFSTERDNVAAYWSGTVKPEMENYKKTHDPTKLLEVSETYFGMTNTMVDAAQSMVDIMAYLLYILLIAFVATVWAFLKKVSQAFQERVVEPIGALDTDIDRLVKGNLTTALKYPHDDEIGKLYNLLDKMRVGLSGYVKDIEQNLRQMADGDLVTETDMRYIGDYEPIQENIGNIRAELTVAFNSMGEIAERVADSASEVSQVSNSLADGATRQTESIQNLQTKIQETMKQNEQVENFVQEALSCGTDTEKNIELSRHRMDKVVTAMQAINNASEEIKSILGTLDAITEQTSLLSLNASIEAARAGESGKGFAVVAGEVRKLAEQSAESSKNIQELINKAISEIENGTAVVGRASTSLSDVTKSNETVTQVINKLSAQSAEQQKRMQEVNELSKKILGVVTDNSAVSQECAAASSELSDYSAAFKESVNRFKTAC